MKLVGLNKLLVPAAMIAVSLLSACGNTKYAKQTHGGSASANNLTVTTKPKIDIVVFQDDSDSIIYNGPLDVLRPQMTAFLSNLSDQWDYRFTVMPLLTYKPLSQKYVVASDCGSISGVAGCLSPSQAGSFITSGDYGWINSSNFSGGNDRGFQNMRTNLSDMGSFIRSDAALAVIVLSNGDDLEGVTYSDLDQDGHPETKNYNTSLANSSFSSFRTYFGGLKPHALLKRFYPVVVNSSGSCLNGYYGKRYVDMSSHFDSRAYNICSGELNSSLNDIKQRLVTITQAIKFDHVVISSGRAPVVSSIKVWKNGVLIPQGGANGWSYVGNQNRATSYEPTAGNYRSGYMIQLSGSARFQGSDQITFDFDPL